MQIGSGTFADVFKVDYCGKLFAKKVCTYEKYRINTNTEKEIMEKLNGKKNHPGYKHIVHIVSSEKNKEGWDIIMDLYEGNLLDLIIQQKMNEEIVIELAKQISLGLAFMDEHQIAHCDLKPENILYKLIETNYHFAISDFGSCIQKGKYKEIHRIQTSKYRCVENMIGIPIIGSCDMPSLGAILYEALTGKYLFNYVDDFQYVQYVLDLIGMKELKLYNSSKFPGFENFKIKEDGILESFDFSKDLIDFIIKSIIPFEDQRLQAKDAINHSLFKKNLKVEKESEDEDYEFYYGYP
jgi:serine/threonine protein kinase